MTKMKNASASGIQIFGIKNSAATRAAERFFKERRIPVQMVDLKQRPIAPGEIRRFIDKFGWDALLDQEGTPYADAGLKYLRVSDEQLIERISREPRLLRLPLVRGGKRLAAGQDESGWKAMLDA